MKNFTSSEDAGDPEPLIKRAIEFKQGNRSISGQGKTLLMLFFNPSLRTRLSTQKAAENLGMNVISMNVNEGWSLETEDGVIMSGESQEHIKDAVKVVSSYCDIIGVRSFPKLQSREEDYEEKVLRAFLKYSGKPIISLESATLHPLQSLADLMTISELGIKKPRIAVTWAPHPKALPQSVANSFLQWIKLTEAEVHLAHPEGYELNESLTSGIQIHHDQESALKDADVVYCKGWSSYKHYGQVLSGFDSWMVDKQKMALTKNPQNFMHCLPIRRNVVATDAVIDHSLVYQQAENRLWTAQSVLDHILKSDEGD